MPARTSARSARRRDKQRQFPPLTSSIAETRRFVRECVEPFVSDSERLGDIELATSELVTNAVEHGEQRPLTVGVDVSETEVVVSVTSSRSTAAMGEPSTWAGPLPAMRTGRGLAIVRTVSDEVSVEADDETLTVHCAFALAGR
jgi:anti-sigma regulatory factor (Ser/Thr protein kinase)